MQFLNPIWLFAIAALINPVIIHLWNIKPGKTLKVGSISLMTSAAQKSSRSFKLNDVLLFLLRCLLLTLLAFLLAMPVWRQYLSAAQTKGWLLIPKESIKEGYNEFKPTIDSLTKAGYEFHYFNKGFIKADLKQVLTDAATQTNPEPVNYWSLIAQLNDQLPAAMPVYLFTSHQARHFTGNKPSIASNVHWQTYTPADSLSTWIESAWFTNTNAIKVVEGNSKPSGTYFTSYIIQSGGGANAVFTVNINNGKPEISLKNSDQKAIPIDTNSLRIAIFTDKHSTDATYLKAALDAVSNFSGHKTIIKQYSDAGQIPAAQNWIFWLSEKPVDINSLKKTINILNYEPGQVNNTVSWIKTNGAFSVAGQQCFPALYKLVKDGATNLQPVWLDGYGNAVLNMQQNQHTTSYHFYSRFNPAWNELVWSDGFPKLLLKLMTVNHNAHQMTQHDRRVMDQQQLRPYVIPSVKNTDAHKITIQTDLTHYFWLALVFVFFVERSLAHKNKLVPKNG
ncbi:MAG TPA: BatA domain-containing protein [Mucilaginibacter sp.]|nr:BatA domain-containing protein [Mucilaginibacter sp.]